MSDRVLIGKHADKMFHFTCFNVEDPDDPAVGLVNGEVAIPGNLLRREVFDPVVDEVGLGSLFAGRVPWRSHHRETYGTAPLRCRS